MGNRVVREGILDSEKVNKLSWPGEVFYRRLMSILDDFGRGDGRIPMIRSRLYPLKLDKVSDADVAKWLTECVGAGLVSVYRVEGKDFMEMADFRQTVRIKKAKYPAPQMQADASRCVAESNPKRNPNPESEIESPVIVWPLFEDFWNMYDKKMDRPKCEKKWEKIPQAERDKIMFHIEEYVKATPDPQYRKNPITYLNNESWNNPIIKPQILPNAKRNTNSAEQIKPGTHYAGSL